MYHIYCKRQHLISYKFKKRERDVDIWYWDCPEYSGAWGAITHNGNYHACGDMRNKDKHLESTKIWGEILSRADGQDCEVIVEAVHACRAKGFPACSALVLRTAGRIALAERFDCPWHLVSPREWKKEMGLTSDKDDSLAMARELWPNAPLARKKDNGRAEALLLAEFWRRRLFDI